MKSETRPFVGWLNAEQAAEYLGFTGPRAKRNLYEACDRLGIRKHYLGQLLRFRVVDLDRAVEAAPEPQQARLTVFSEGKR